MDINVILFEENCRSYLESGVDFKEGGYKKKSCDP